MAENKSVNRYTGKDGHRVDQRITEAHDDNGRTSVVVEMHFEYGHVADNVVPMVTEMRDNKMEARIEPASDNRNLATKEDVAEAVRVAFEKMLPVRATEATLSKSDIVDAVRMAFEKMLPVKSTVSISKPDIVEAVKSVLVDMNLQNKVEEPVEEEEDVPPQKTDYGDWMDWGLYLVLSAETAFIVYQFFLRPWLER